MEDCLFCKIVNKKVASDIVLEDDSIIIFKDINPKADVHLLIVLKKHIESVEHLVEEDKELISQMIFAAQKIARQIGVAKNGYKLQFNVGRDGGQIIDHIHLHLIANVK
ncbi:MAG: histidine triad nucleotide-binding protein [Candidatus Portnoybacteria bacterium CG10_big_fil_rev_8_21_14_0_10_36_7]|uniref:Histidine triad nucleotide-binding protein n=1 Tax=Candidatus Portnoybacteria bacterium CG10_big_fil_rev_8_21_14_0_10_36_7 TaxID=1974812 RepID=A0A2M8KE91_9BACT|nr:MAG: histidine triad nucleotide-binding protein [Candidatus Portnoybacteria bacterium CG10_big_fil_rev_8_21_14_0_10_36_7]